MPSEETLPSQRILWIVLTAAAIVSFSLLFIKYTLPVSPVLVIFLILATSSIIITFVPSERTKKLYKVAFLCVTVFVSGFTFGIFAGLFESIVLLPDSMIDLSRSLVSLHIQNNGLTDLTINEVDVEDIKFVLEFPGAVDKYLQPGGSAYLTLDYIYSTFDWPTFLNRVDETGDCEINKEFSPTTFQPHSVYNVALITNGVIKHSFQVEAKLTSDENLTISPRIWHFQDGAQLDVKFNTTQNWVFVYSIQMVNITFYFKPPNGISKYEEDELFINFASAAYFYWECWGYSGNLNATLTPTYSMLQAGKTYDIVVTTMTNTTYTTNVTI